MHLALTIYVKTIIGIICIGFMFKNAPADTHKRPIVSKKRRHIYKLISTIVAIVMVIDSMGIGAMSDCKDFNDIPECNTLKHVCEFNNGLNVPNMQKIGLGNIQDFEGINKEPDPIGKYGTLIEKSKGKDTTTGHWEMAGLISPKPFSPSLNFSPPTLSEHRAS